MNDKPDVANPIEDNPDVVPGRVVVTENDTNWERVMPKEIRDILDAAQE